MKISSILTIHGSYLFIYFYKFKQFFLLYRQLKQTLRASSCGTQLTGHSYVPCIVTHSLSLRWHSHITVTSCCLCPGIEHGQCTGRKQQINQSQVLTAQLLWLDMIKIKLKIRWKSRILVWENLYDTCIYKFVYQFLIIIS